MSSGLPDDWIEHRRDDGELLSWITPDGDRYRAIDVLGRTVASDSEWLDAEAALEAHGLHWLAERWSLTLDDGRQQRVRISQLSPAGITVVDDNWGAAAAVGSGMLERRLPWPAPPELRPWSEAGRE